MAGPPPPFALRPPRSESPPCAQSQVLDCFRFPLQDRLTVQRRLNTRMLGCRRQPWQGGLPEHRIHLHHLLCQVYTTEAQQREDTSRGVFLQANNA
jgi:hypothetical protein